MGNCSCLERGRVTAWDDDEDWSSLPAAAERSGGARGMGSTENGGGMRVKIRMTKGQLRRLLEISGGGRGGAAPDQDVVAEIMSMGTVRVDVAELRQEAAEKRRPTKLETIQEDDMDAQ